MATLREQAREKLEERAKLIRENRPLAAQTDMSDEVKAEYDKRWTDIGALKDAADQLVRQAEAEDGLENAVQKDVDDGNRSKESPEDRTAMEVFERMLVGGQSSLTDTEYRALQQDIDESGGFLVPPMQFINQLIQAVDDAVWIRGLATTFQVTDAKSIGAPSLDADPSDADWTTELAIGDEDSTMDFGNREMVPHPLAKLLKVSRKLLRSVPSVSNLVAERLGYKFGITQEKAFLTGSGASQPLGLFTASSMGISTDRDVSDGNTSSSMTTDGLTSAKYSLKLQYRNNSRWLFHRDGVEQIAKLKDGNGQYLWRESVRAGEPDRLLGLPIMESEYSPNTFTSGLYVGMLANFQHYWIVDALSFTLQRLDELYAATNQVGFIGRMESDGAPVLEEAFARIKLG